MRSEEPLAMELKMAAFIRVRLDALVLAVAAPTCRDETAPQMGASLAVLIPD
jgi:hypothetical protein